MRYGSWALVLVLVACSGNDRTPSTRDAGQPERDAGQTERDAGQTERDAGQTERDGGDPGRDAGPPHDAGPAPACPTAADYVGDPTWPGRLEVPSEARLCRFAKQFEDIYVADTRKRVLRIAPGSYPLPVVSTGEPIRLPVCYLYEPANAIREGTVTAERMQSFEDPTERYYVTSAMPDDSRAEVRVTARLEIATPTLDLSDPPADHFQLTAQRCVTDDCFDESDDALARCDLRSRMCDMLDFTDGTITVDQFHWAGSVGAGFAAPVRARGTFRGTPFDITAYEQMTLAYGHHAFNRELLLHFDPPIDGVCALHFPEVTEFGQLDPVEIIDCSGNVTGSTPITADSHLFGQPCP